MFTRAALLLLVAAALPVHAEMIPIGTITLGYDFDLSTYIIQIANFTGDPGDGGYSIPGYPVLTPLLLDNPVVTYTVLDEFGASNTSTVYLDSISPGYFTSPDTLVFFDDATTAFTSIAFSATIFPDTLLVGSQQYTSADGTAYALLEHADGTALSAFDTADIQVGADPTGSTDLPEPAPALLLASGLLACTAARRRNAA